MYTARNSVAFMQDVLAQLAGCVGTRPVDPGSRVCILATFRVSHRCIRAWSEKLVVSATEPDYGFMAPLDVQACEIGAQLLQLG